MAPVLRVSHGEGFAGGLPEFDIFGNIVFQASVASLK
jgi:hypothetical protein